MFGSILGTLACFTCLALLTAQAEDKVVQHGFPMVIEGVTCRVEAYQAVSPIILEPMVDKDFLPRSQLIVAIMLTHSDLSSYMSDEEFFGFARATVDPEKANKHRSLMKERYEMTGPSAADNPWKGMKYVLDEAFVVDSEHGRFLVYRLSTQGGKGIEGKLTSSVKNVDGRWSIGGTEGDPGQKFQRSMLELVPVEFAKLREAASIEPLPLEGLLK